MGLINSLNTINNAVETLQIKSELTQHHKHVFEVLSSKLQVQDVRPQVSGLGFSITNPNSFICKLDNNRIVKVKVGK